MGEEVYCGLQRSTVDKADFLHIALYCSVVKSCQRPSGDTAGMFNIPLKTFFPICNQQLILCLQGKVFCTKQEFK